MTFSLTSPAFEHNGMIPAKYTCDAENGNPPLRIDGVPEGTRSLVLVVDDPDIPAEVTEKMGISIFDHWVLYNLPPETKEITEGNQEGIEGLNSRGEMGYRGPCPPAEYEPYTHRYIFRLYAISDTLDFAQTPTLREVEEVAERTMIEKTELIGLYTRKTEATVTE